MKTSVKIEEKMWNYKELGQASRTCPVCSFEQTPDDGLLCMRIYYG